MLVRAPAHLSATGERSSRQSVSVELKPSNLFLTVVRDLPQMITNLHPASFAQRVADHEDHRERLIHPEFDVPLRKALEDLNTVLLASCQVRIAGFQLQIYLSAGRFRKTSYLKFESALIWLAGWSSTAYSDS